MKPVWVRQLKVDDQKYLAKWMVETPQNLLDPDVFGYPETSILVAHDEQPLIFMPIQLTATLESLAVRPGASPLQVAEALKQLIKATVLLAGAKGIHELYFLCKDPDVVKLAKHHGFEELPWTTLRLKIDKLEKHEQASANPPVTQ